MLSAADSDLVRRDVTLPGLATVLDPEALTELLRRRFPDVGLGSAQITYLKYRPQRYCRVGYRLQTPVGAIDAYANAYSPNAIELRRARTDAGVPGALGRGRVVWDEEAVVLSVFPNDFGLPALSRLSNVTECKELLRDVCTHRPDLWSGRMETIRYRPERRYVARLLGNDNSSAVLKWYTKREYPMARANALHFHKQGRFRVPPLLGLSDHDGLVAMECLSGRMMEDVLTSPEIDVSAVRQAAEALADFHAHGLAGNLPQVRDKVCNVVGWAAEEVGVVLPHLRARVLDLGRRLVDALRRSSAPNGPVHGDLSHRQIILSADGVGFVDFDDAGRGDRAIDLGYLLASLEQLVLLGRMSQERMDAIAAAFVTAYEGAMPAPAPRTVATYVAVGLFRKAVHPFRQRAIDWPRQIETMLQRVDVLVRRQEYEPAI